MSINVDVARYALLGELVKNGKASAEDRADYDALGRKLETRGNREEPDTRGYTGESAPRRGGAYVGGKEKELRADQSVFDYGRANGLTDNEKLPKALRSGTREERYEVYDDYFRTHPIFGMAGFQKRTVFGLGEDNAGGAGGAGGGLVPTILSHDVADLIRAKTFLFQAGATTVPLPSEFYNLPTFEADIEPAYLTESQSVALDTTPQVSFLPFVCSNAWIDVSGTSLNLLEDAYNTGGIAELLMHSISERWSRKLQSLAMYGEATAPANAMPGVINENILTQSMGTNGAAPTDFRDVSKAVAQLRAQNVEPSAIVAHPSVVAEYGQLVDTLGQPMRKTPDIESIPWHDSGLLNGYTETQGTSSLASSLFVADWSYVKVGIRLRETFQVLPRLDQRYIDNQVVAWMSRFRGSVRVLRPTQTVCRLEGILA